jgi:hypothetical protein
MEAWEQERIDQGYRARKSEESHIVSCSMCKEAKGWVRYFKDGTLQHRVA